MVIVKRKELSLAERLYLPEIARALSMSLRAIFAPKVTRQYPEQPLPTTAVTRGQPRLVLLDDNQHLACVSCGLCEIACPAYAITIDGGETDRPIEREPVRLRSTCCAASCAASARRPARRTRSSCRTSSSWPTSRARP